MCTPGHSLCGPAGPRWQRPSCPGLLGAGTTACPTAHRWQLFLLPGTERTALHSPAGAPGAADLTRLAVTISAAGGRQVFVSSPPSLRTELHFQPFIFDSH